MIEFQFQYKPFMSVGVLHDYYVKNLKRDLMFVPSHETVKEIGRMGFLLKNVDKGMTVSYDTSEADKLVKLIEKRDDIEFTFFLVSSNGFFVNFTDMSAESVGSIFQFHGSNAVKKEAGEFSLHKSDTASKADVLSIRNADFYFDTQGKKTKIGLKSGDGTIVLEEEVEGVEKYIVPLSKFSQGSYTLMVNGKEAERFAYVNQSFGRKQVVAMVTISLTGALKKEVINTLDKGEMLSEKSYSVRFGSRSTYWKYFFVSKYKLQLEKSSIVTNDSKIQFDGPQKVPLSNGETAYMFQSKAPLPLKEMSSFNFKLSKDKSNGEAFLNRLPVPSPDSIKPESRDESAKIYSELIVYV